MEDLDKLIEAIEKGDSKFISRREYANIGVGGANAGTIRAAFWGGLDAAMALHEVLLPGWKWGVVDHADGDFGAGVGLKEVDEMIGVSTNAARSWLIAILKAHRHNLANGAAQ